jgi:intein/homing endonuclease
MMVEMTPELAEICGIHAGDGYLRDDGKRRELDISGSFEEQVYYDNHVIPLFSKELGLDVKGKTFASRGTYGFVLRGKEITKFFNQDLGFNLGPKSLTVKVPEQIFNSKDLLIISRFLRGLFDTDGSLYFKNKRTCKKYTEFKKTHNYYPVISFTTVSKDLAYQIKDLLLKFGFSRVNIYVYNPKAINDNLSYKTYFSGTDNLIKFFNEIGSMNPIKFSRFELWKKQGYCQPHLSYLERVKLLKGG